jgi:hypothetical protein
MKKAIAAILLVLYVAFSTGVVISFHYCMNDLDSLQLGAAKTEICGKCGMHQEKANACCNDEVKIFKIQDDQQLSAISYKFASPETIITPLPVWDEAAFITPAHQLFLNNHSPPLPKQNTYLRNCVFRI